MGLALAVLGLAGSLAHADPYYGGGPPLLPTCNASFYVANPGGCWYGPNYCYRGPCMPPAPFGGVLPLPKEYEKNQAPAYATPGLRVPGYAPAPGYPGVPPLAGMQVPYVGRPGVPPPPGTPVFPTHPFARSPRDFFMFGQTFND